jgi:hypothetical protein
MGLAHSCPDGKHTKLIRTGPLGTEEGVTFRCPRCGESKSGAQIMADFQAIRPRIIAALR